MKFFWGGELNYFSSQITNELITEFSNFFPNFLRGRKILIAHPNFYSNVLQIYYKILRNRARVFVCYYLSLLSNERSLFYSFHPSFQVFPSLIVNRSFWSKTKIYNDLSRVTFILWNLIQIFIALSSFINATISILLQRETNVRDLYFPVARLSQLFTTIHVCSSLSFVHSEPFLFSRE